MNPFNYFRKCEDYDELHEDLHTNDPVLFLEASIKSIKSVYNKLKCFKKRKSKDQKITSEIERLKTLSKKLCEDFMIVLRDLNNKCLNTNDLKQQLDKLLIALNQKMKLLLEIENNILSGNLTGKISQETIDKISSLNRLTYVAMNEEQKAGFEKEIERLLKNNYNQQSILEFIQQEIKRCTEDIKSTREKLMYERSVPNEDPEAIKMVIKSLEFSKGAMFQDIKNMSFGKSKKRSKKRYSKKRYPKKRYSKKRYSKK